LIAALRQVKRVEVIVASTEPDFAAQLAAAIDWWRAAGVEHDFADEPRGWIAMPDEAALPEAAAPPKFVAPPPPAAPQIGAEQAQWPATLADFSAWWLTEPTLDHGSVSGRMPPRGPAGAELMLLVEHPEQQDSDVLLSGPHGKLLSAMLNAMGIAEEAVYFASALPRHTQMPDWAALGRDGLGGVLVHHIDLVAPKRLITFGRNVATLISSPIGHDPAKSAESSSQLNQEGTSVPLLAATGLDMILSKPQGKARFWGRWLEWTGTKST
jgi:uracil-DNA glycosylase